MNRSALADDGTVANDRERLLSVELQVLWDSSYYGRGEDAAVGTDTCAVHDGRIRHHDGTWTDGHVVFNICERANLGRGVYLGVRMDACEGMNHMIVES